MPIGDVTATFGIDDSRWIAGVTRMQNANKGLRNSFQQDLGRSVAQVGFAVQDFASVFSMGGDRALSRAMLSTLNNVQMLGAAFGGWGLAITSAAGAIGAILLPKIFDMLDGAKGLSEEFAKLKKTTEEWAKVSGERAAFRATIDDMEHKEDAASLRKRTERDLERMRAERAALEEGGELFLRGELKNNRITMPSLPSDAGTETRLRSAFANEGWSNIWRNFLTTGIPTSEGPSGNPASVEEARRRAEQLRLSGHEIREAERRLEALRKLEAELPEKQKRGGAHDLDATELGTVGHWRKVVDAMRGAGSKEPADKEGQNAAVAAINEGNGKLDKVITALKAAGIPTVGIGAGN